MKSISRFFSFIMPIALLVAISGCIGIDNKEEKASAVSEINSLPVGDINISCKVLGQGYPIVLIMGYSGTMDSWDPRFLDGLSSKYSVIVFDNRGMGYTTAPPGNFSIVQFANDTAGLMTALGIEKAHILGYSMGSFVAQELAIRYPDRVNKTILYGGMCGGNKSIWASPEVLEALSNTSGSQEERGMRLINMLFPREWLLTHQQYSEWFHVPKETSLPKNIDRQMQAIVNWPGACDRLGSIKSPTLVVTGTEDILIPPENAFIISPRINGSWVVQFKGAGHGLMYQYPDRFAKVVEDFIEISN